MLQPATYGAEPVPWDPPSQALPSALMFRRLGRAKLASTRLEPHVRPAREQEAWHQKADRALSAVAPVSLA